MRNKTILLAILLILFVLLGVKTITNGKHKIKLQDIQLKSKQSDLIQLENKFELLNKELEVKSLDAEKAKQLENEKQELQKQLEQAQKDLQAKAEAKRLAQVKVQQAASMTATVSASGDCVSEIQKYGWNHNTAIAVARAESQLNPAAHNFSHATKDDSWGCFQVNLYGANARNRPPSSQLVNAAVNVQWAYNNYVANGHSFIGQWGVCRKIACY